MMFLMYNYIFIDSCIICSTGSFFVTCNFAVPGVSVPDVSVPGVSSFLILATTSSESVGEHPLWSWRLGLKHTALIRNPGKRSLLEGMWCLPTDAALIWVYGYQVTILAGVQNLLGCGLFLFCLVSRFPPTSLLLEEQECTWFMCDVRLGMRILFI